MRRLEEVEDIDMSDLSFKLDLLKGIDDDRYAEFVDMLIASSERNPDKILRILEGKEKRLSNVKDTRVFKVRENKDCGRCGKMHKNDSCPAIGKQCNKCGLMNHFESKFRTNSQNKNDNRKGKRGRVYMAKTGKERPGIPPHRFILDGGATSHMTPSRERFVEYRNYKSKVILGDENIHLDVHGIGTVVLDNDITLTNVLYVPNLSHGLLSEPILDLAGCKIVKEDGKCVVIDDGEVVISAHLVYMAYLVNERVYRERIFMSYHNHIASSENSEDPRFQQNEMSETMYWHMTLGHASSAKLRQAGIKNVTEIQCEQCALYKLKEKKVAEISDNEKNEGEYVVDLEGPFPKSPGGYRFNLTIIQLRSREAWTEQLCRKKEADSFLRGFMKSHNVKVLRHDGGGEFIGKPLIGYLNSKGIRVEDTARDTPEHTGIVERCGQTIMNKVGPLLSQAGLEVKYWPAAVKHSTFLYNRLPHSALEGKSPYEMSTGKKFDIHKLKPFGCLAYGKIPTKRRRKMQCCI